LPDPPTRSLRRPEPAQIALPRSPSSVATARRFIKARAAAWSFPERASEQLVLIGSELVTNAVLHARTELLLILELRGDRVRISVKDGSGAPATMRHYRTDALTGRGLGVVAALSDTWGSARPPTARSSGPSWATTATSPQPPRGRPTCATPLPPHPPTPQGPARSASSASRWTATWSSRPTTTRCSASWS
jgi:anti-sigma regulatory factor (Ser/Thr protein kinase)